jgi:hypothetical protein
LMAVCFAEHEANKRTITQLKISLIVFIR